MKEFIVLIAVLPLMLVFVMQYSNEQVNHSKEVCLHEYVYAAAEQARQDGYYTTENLDNLTEKIVEKFNVSPDEVIIEADRSARYRVNEFDERELIDIRVEVPVKNAMAGAALFGISSEENVKVCSAGVSAVSERLPY